MTIPAIAPSETHRIMESWEITTAGRVWLTITGHNRFGQMMEKKTSIGPNKAGSKLKISQADRELNQEMVADEKHDPFRNGLLVRVDADQNDDPATASRDAVPMKELLTVFEKHGNAFQSAVNGLGEVPVRRMRELADEVEASAKQRDFLDETIEERFTHRRSQEDAVYDLQGQRTKARERAVSADDEVGSDD